MCQSKAEGGRRCAAHNNQREFNRARRAVKEAVKERDRLAAAWDAGNPRVTADDLIAAEREVALRADVAVLLDPKITDERLSELWADASPEVQAAAAPVAESAIAHGKAAARLSGQAATERMFDRTAEAETFEAEADGERTKMQRMVSGLHAALVHAKSDLEELAADRRADAADRSAVAVKKKNNTEPGLFRSFFDEVLEATEDAMIETAEGLAAGLGIEVADHPAAGKDTEIRSVEPVSDETATGDGGRDRDQDEAPTGSDLGGDDDHPTDAADDPVHQDAEGEDGEGNEAVDDATEKPTQEKAKASTERRSPQPADARPAAVAGSSVRDLGQDRVQDRVGPPKAGGIGDRVRGQDQDGAKRSEGGGAAVAHDHLTPTAAAARPTDLGHRAAVKNGIPAAAEHVPYGAGGGSEDQGQHLTQDQDDGGRGLDLDNPAAADDLDYTADLDYQIADAVAVPADLSQLSDEELRALIDQLQRR